MKKAFGLKDSKGMVEVLVGEAEIDEVVQPTSFKNLYVIPRGSKTPNPAELLDSESMRGIIEELKEKFDFIIFDSPPVGSVVDASILGTLVDGTMLVVEAGRFEARFIQRAKNQIESARGHVLGIVLNKSHRQGHGYYYQQYYAYQPETESSSATS